jgi:hypothetical protein
VQALLTFIHPCKILVDTYLREYNKFAIRVVVHNFVVFIYANEEVVLGLL